MAQTHNQNIKIGSGVKVGNVGHDSVGSFNAPSAAAQPATPAAALAARPPFDEIEVGDNTHVGNIGNRSSGHFIPLAQADMAVAPPAYEEESKASMDHDFS